MDSITLSSTWAIIIAICAGLVTLATCWEKVFRPLFGKSDLKKRIDTVDAKLDSDNKRIRSLEEAQIIQIQTLLALTRHSIDGNNIQGLKDQRDAIQDYLIKRRI